MSLCTYIAMGSPKYIPCRVLGHPSKVSPMTDQVKEKIRSMAKADIPIAERRALYNQMGRRMKSGHGLKAGLVQKYNACLNDQKERFNLLKEFMIDEQMPGTQSASHGNVSK